MFLLDGVVLELSSTTISDVDLFSSQFTFFWIMTLVLPTISLTASYPFHQNNEFYNFYYLPFLWSFLFQIIVVHYLISQKCVVMMGPSIWPTPQRLSVLSFLKTSVRFKWRGKVIPTSSRHSISKIAWKRWFPSHFIRTFK